MAVDATVVAMGNSHTLQTLTTLVCQFEDEINDYDDALLLRGSNNHRHSMMDMTVDTSIQKQLDPCEFHRVSDDAQSALGFSH